jgi:hypothetical protein
LKQPRRLARDLAAENERRVEFVALILEHARVAPVHLAQGVADHARRVNMFDRAEYAARPLEFAGKLVQR